MGGPAREVSAESTGTAVFEFDPNPETVLASPAMDLMDDTCIRLFIRTCDASSIYGAHVYLCYYCGKVQREFVT